MSVLHTLVSKAGSGLTEVGNSASSGRPTQGSHQPGSAPLAKRKPTAVGTPFESRRVVADARAAKYLLFAMLGVLMVALVACGASGEPTSDEPSGGVAPAPTEVPTDAPTAAQPANAVASEPTATPAATEAPVPTVVPTMTAPTNTPEPTATSAPPPTPTQSVEELKELLASITTPGPGVDTEGIWWWREPKRDGHRGMLRDYTPEGVYENHPNGPALDLLDGWLQYHHDIGERNTPHWGVLEAHKHSVHGATWVPIYEALMETEGRKRVWKEKTREEFLETLAWEVVRQDEPVLRYWSLLSASNLEHDYRIGFTARFEVSGKDLAMIHGYHRVRDYPLDEYLITPSLIGDVEIEIVE